MSVSAALLLLLGLQIKHLFADFFWQTSYMISGKLRYGHPGGLIHAGIHGALSFLVLLALVTVLSIDLPRGVLALVTLAAVEVFVHYHIDWLKARDGDLRQRQPHDQSFWRAFGVDQAAHHMTYLAMVGWIALQTGV